MLFQGSLCLVEKHVFFGMEGPKMVLKCCVKMLLNLPTQPVWIDFCENIIDQRIKKRLSTPVELSFFPSGSLFLK